MHTYAYMCSLNISQTQLRELIIPFVIRVRTDPIAIVVFCLKQAAVVMRQTVGRVTTSNPPKTFVRGTLISKRQLFVSIDILHAFFRELARFLEIENQKVPPIIKAIALSEIHFKAKQVELS